MDTIRDSLNEINNGDNLNLYVLTRHKKDHDVYRIFSLNLNHDFRNNMLNTFKEEFRNIRNHPNYNIIDYSIVPNFENGEVMRLELEEIHLLDNFNNYINQNPPNYDHNLILNEGHEVWAFIFRIAHIVGDDINYIVSFHKFKQRKLLSYEDSKIFKIFQSPDGEFIEVVDDILAINHDMDCIYYYNNNPQENERQYMYIIKKHFFEQIFGIEETFQLNLNNMLNDERDRRLAEDEEINLNFDFLTEKSLNNGVLFRKLYKILEEGRFQLLTLENIERLRDERRVVIQINNGQVVLETNDDIKKLLHFLNEDFYVDTITNNYWTSISKRPTQ